MNEVFDGTRNYALDLPIIPGPGGIGRVRAVGPDATKLGVGDWVFCDPTVRSRDDAVAPDIALQGLTAAGPGGMRLQQHFRHGSFAGQMRVPTENVKRIGAITPEQAAPIASATDTAALPKLPVAPLTSTVSPGCRLAARKPP